MEKIEKVLEERSSNTPKKLPKALSGRIQREPRRPDFRFEPPRQSGDTSRRSPVGIPWVPDLTHSDLTKHPEHRSSGMHRLRRSEETEKTRSPGPIVSVSHPHPAVG